MSTLSLLVAVRHCLAASASYCEGGGGGPSLVRLLQYPLAVGIMYRPILGTTFCLSTKFHTAVYACMGNSICGTVN